MSTRTQVLVLNLKKEEVAASRSTAIRHEHGNQAGDDESSEMAPPSLPEVAHGDQPNIENLFDAEERLQEADAENNPTTNPSSESLPSTLGQVSDSEQGEQTPADLEGESTAVEPDASADVGDEDIRVNSTASLPAVGVRKRFFDAISRKKQTLTRLVIGRANRVKTVAVHGATATGRAMRSARASGINMISRNRYALAAAMLAVVIVFFASSVDVAALRNYIDALQERVQKIWKGGETEKAMIDGGLTRELTKYELLDRIAERQGAERTNTLEQILRKI